MKVLHVVTLVSKEASYGGPVRVASNLCRELQGRGHQVTLIAGVPPGQDDVSAHLSLRNRLFRVYRLTKPGFSGLIAPRMLWWLLRHARDFDVVHVHLARDLITTPAALMAIVRGVPLVVQTHGMVAPKQSLVAKIFDLMLIQPILRHALTVLYLTNRECADLRSVGAQCERLRHLPNGVPEARATSPITGHTEVLFLARLHERKRPMRLLKASEAVMAALPAFTVSFAGPDEGEAMRLQEAISESPWSGRFRLEPPLDPRDTLDRMRESQVYALPSVEEPFPMSVLEAMSAALPVIVGSTCGLADLVRETNSGLIVEDDQESLELAITTLVTDVDLRQALGRNGQSAVRDRFSMSRVVDSLLEAYSDPAPQRAE